MKSLFLKIMLAITIIFAVPFTISAQDQNAQVPPAVQYLMKFIGRWEGNTTLIMEGKTYQVDYWVACKKSNDGNGLYLDEGFTHPELGTLKGSNLAGYDPYDAKIKWFTVDNVGTAHEHVGEWLTPDHLYIEHDGIRNGKKYVEKIDFIFNGKDEMTLKIIGTLDSVESESAKGVFHRKPVTDK